MMPHSEEIQTYGLLFVLSEPDLVVRQVSSNVSHVLKMSPADVLNRSFEAVLGVEQSESFRVKVLKFEQLGTTLLSVPVNGSVLEMQCTAHRRDDALVVELEPQQGAHLLGPLDIDLHIRVPFLRMELSSDIPELSQIAASEIQKLSGFDRIMVLRFDEVGNGDVIAEAVGLSRSMYCGMRFPAVDIPTEVSKDFPRNPWRVIADVTAVPSSIIPELSPLTGKAVDLTSIVLRSASPTHLEYLSNMKVQASMTISIAVEGRLWGMIVCHHSTKYRVDRSTRSICELIVQGFASQVASRIEDAGLRSRLIFRKKLETYMAGVGASKSLSDSSHFQSHWLPDLLDAHGLVSSIDGLVSSQGATLEAELLQSVIDRLQGLASKGIASSNKLSDICPGVGSNADQISGALYLSLADDSGDFLLLFRKEFVKTVIWAGNPKEAVIADEHGQLHPRTSFEGWHEEVRGCCQPWTEVELERASFLRGQLLRLRDVQRLAVLNDSFGREITERKRAEAGLELAKESAEAASRLLSTQHLVLESERAMLRALIDNIPDYMYVKDRESRFVVANLHVTRMVGLEKPEELLGRTDFDFYPQEIAKAFYEDEQEVMRSGQPLFDREEIAIDGSGNEIPILTTKVPLLDIGGKTTGIAGVGRVISERKKSENALREAERKYRGIFDEAIVGVFQISPTGFPLHVNPAMASSFGYASPEEMISIMTDAWQLIVDPKSREELRSIMNKLGRVQNFECEVFRRDGGTFWISASIRAIVENGATVRLEGMLMDITERKILSEQLLQAQKLESVGQLAAGIAHEINTPTQYIGDNVRFLKDSFQDLITLLGSYGRLLIAAKAKTLTSVTLDETTSAAEHADVGYLIQEIPKAIEQALEGVTRVSTLVSAMKEFSHPGTKQKIPLDLNHAIESTITVARNEWRYVADLDRDFDPLLPMVSCQPGEFNQVILNLIVNAAHAIADVVARGGPGRGTISVQTRDCPTCVEIRIRDTGDGIPERVRARIFDPFFTTKEIGRGTGQGLAIARSVIVDKHGGSIDFETEDGKGTTFIIRLPHDGKTLAAVA